MIGLECVPPPSLRFLSHSSLVQALLVFAGFPSAEPVFKIRSGRPPSFIVVVVNSK